MRNSVHLGICEDGAAAEGQAVEEGLAAEVHPGEGGAAAEDRADKESAAAKVHPAEGGLAAEGRAVEAGVAVEGRVRKGYGIWEYKTLSIKGSIELSIREIDWC
jgi:hypothetical protein